MQAALGVGSRPASTRVRSRKALTSFAHVPSPRHWATGKKSHRRYSWAEHHAAPYPIGSHCGLGRTMYSGLPACRPSEGALLVGSAWQVESSVPRWPMARPSDLMDISSETGLHVPCMRIPLLMGYALTI